MFSKATSPFLAFLKDGKTELSDSGIKEHIEKITKAIPQGHFGKPEDIAVVAAFLASDEAGFITGSIYGIDGGFAGNEG